MESIQSVKQRFGIIGNNEKLNRALEKSIQVSNSDISVLVTGESGVGKENIPKIIHQYSHRKHAKYIAVNCGAIPDGTIDSELFGHEKGAFTGATSNRSGYFEVADGGTIFLDEVGELPLSTQVRLLRILESGEYIKVGSSKVEKTNVRIVAATNTKMEDAISSGKFREDLFYRLSTIIINIPPLRERKEDIPILFRKFASDFAQKYNMPTLRLDEKAEDLLCQNEWRGNIRQLRNIAEQMSILEKERLLNSENLDGYLPNKTSKLPAKLDSIKSDSNSFSSEREILYKVLFDMKSDLTDLKQLTLELIKNDDSTEVKEKNQGLIEKIYGDKSQEEKEISHEIDSVNIKDSDLSIGREEVNNSEKFEYAETIEEEETLSLLDKEIEMIKQALIRTKGKRKLASKELGISERTLYRKIKQYNLGDINEI
jgi:transcriptional regulator with PAS, ATPase and Fis domain